MTTGPQRPYFRKLYGQHEGGEPFSVPFSSPESFETFAAGRIRARDEMRQAGDAADKVARTLRPEQTMRLLIDPDEHRRAVTHSTDLNGTRATNLPELRKIKSAEARRPAGQGHGSGLYDELAAGGEVRDPIRVIVQPSKLLQHEGHHRIEAAGDVQMATGVRKLVPIELHSRVFSSMGAERLQRIRESGES